MVPDEKPANRKAANLRQLEALNAHFTTCIVPQYENLSKYAWTMLVEDVRKKAERLGVLIEENYIKIADALETGGEQEVRDSRRQFIQRLLR